MQPTTLPPTSSARCRASRPPRRHSAHEASATKINSNRLLSCGTQAQRLAVPSGTETSESPHKATCARSLTCTKLTLTPVVKFSTSVATRSTTIAASRLLRPVPRCRRTNSAVVTTNTANGTCAARMAAAEACGVAACIICSSKTPKPAADAASTKNSRKSRRSRWRTQTNRCSRASVRPAATIAIHASSTPFIAAIGRSRTSAFSAWVGQYRQRALGPWSSGATRSAGG